MDWNWVSFVVGVLVGSGLMWLAAVLSQVGEAENEEHFR